MNTRRIGRREAGIFISTALIFLILTYISNTLLAAYDVTSVRPSAAMNPVLGIAFGWPAILGCAMANFASDIISGYGITVAFLGFIPQIIYGAVPYYVWNYFARCASNRTRLDSPTKTVAFGLLMAVDSAIIGLAVGAINFYVAGFNFAESAFFAFLNDFCMCLIFGLPLMVVLDWVYSRFTHKGRRGLSVNETVIAWTALAQFLIAVVIIIVNILSARNSRVALLWGNIFTYIGYVIMGVMFISLIILCYLRYLKKKNEGLRVFDRPSGTIYADEKRKLEFTSYPGKALKYRIKSASLGSAYEDIKKPMKPTYRTAWRISLSCQKGCPMKCKFCDCPAYGFFGNATKDDLKYQIETIINHNGSAITNRMEVDFSRMGEPSLNPDLLPFLESDLQNLIRQKVEAEIIYPTVSTMMPAKAEVKDFLKDYCRIKNETYAGDADLKISLNSTDEDLRRTMYGKASMSLEEIAAIANDLPTPKGRKYALTFALTKDSLIDARRINSLFDKSKFLIELSPIHQTFNASDNGFDITTEYTDSAVYEPFEKAFAELGWEVEVYLDPGEEDADALTSGHLLLPNIREKINKRPSRKKRIGMIVAIEMDAIFEHYKTWKELPSPPGFNLYLVERDTYDIYILQAGMGVIAASSGVQYLIAKCNVSYIVNFGVVGGLTADMKTMKVCLVDRVVHYKYDCSEFMDLAIGQVDGHDSIYLPTSESLVKSALSAMEGLSLVTCCSGDKFISTMEEKQYLHDTFGGDICDMESAGIVLTCEANGVRCLLMKAVSDGLADGAEGFYAELKNASLKCLVATDAIMEHLAEIES